MKLFHVAAAAAVAVGLGLVTESRAAVLLSDNFDSYANQAAFEASAFLQQGA